MAQCSLASKVRNRHKACSDLHSGTRGLPPSEAEAGPELKLVLCAGASWLQAGVATKVVNVIRSTRAVNESVRTNPDLSRETSFFSTTESRVDGSSDSKRVVSRYNKSRLIANPLPKTISAQFHKSLSGREIEFTSECRKEHTLAWLVRRDEVRGQAREGRSVGSLGQAGFQSRSSLHQAIAWAKRSGMRATYSACSGSARTRGRSRDVCQLQCFLKGCDLLSRPRRRLNPGFPTPFFDIEYTVLRVILVFDSFRTKEERDAIRELVRRWVRIHVPAL